MMCAAQKGTSLAQLKHAREFMALTTTGVCNYNKAKSTVVSHGASASGLYILGSFKYNLNTTYASRSTIGRACRRRRNSSAHKKRKVIRGFGAE